MKFVLISLLSLITLSSCSIDNNTKDYIIENSNEIKLVNTFEYDSLSNQFKIDLTHQDKYHKDITITKSKSDSTYRIILWGDRESFWWDYRLDHSIEVDVIYKRYKGKDVKKDIRIIEVLDSIVRKDSILNQEHFILL